MFITIAALAVTAHFKAMTTDPGAVPPDANPLPDNLDELDTFVKGERSPQSSPRKQHPASSASANNVDGGVTGANAMERGVGNNNGNDAPSSLMQEDATLDDNNMMGSLLDNTHGSGGSSNGGMNRTVPQAVAAASAVGAAVVGAASVAGVAGAAAVAGVAAAGGVAPIRPSGSRGGGPQQPRGRRMCRRCQAFKPPRAHHCRYVIVCIGCALFWVELFEIQPIAGHYVTLLV